MVGGYDAGAIHRLFLTLMDRIDEHRIIERHRTQWAYLADSATAAVMAWSIALFPIVYPLIFGLPFMWIVKDKIDFLSHVFFLFLLTLFLGYRLDLLQLYWRYILLVVVLHYLSGTVLRRLARGGASGAGGARATGKNWPVMSSWPWLWIA